MKQVWILRLRALIVVAICLAQVGCAGGLPGTGTNGDERSMLSDAISEDNPARVREIVAANPRIVHAQIFGEWTPLHEVARSSGDSAISIAEILLLHGADPNAQESEGNTPLHLAVGRVARQDLSDNVYLGIIRVLLDAEADVSVKNVVGATPLHILCVYDGSVSAADLILSHGADVNSWALPQPSWAGPQGWLPIHGAASQGRADLVEFLISKGADSNAKDGNGETALQIAEKFGHEEVAKVLRELASGNE